MIASTDKAVNEQKNSFTSGGTLSISDIRNSAGYQGKATGISIDVGQQAGKFGVSGVGAGIGSDKGNAGSTSSAGISGIAGNTAIRSTDAETGIAKIFDADKVQKEINAQVQIMQAFTKETPKAVADYSASKSKDLKERAGKETDADKKAALQAEAAKWDEGGIYRVALHAAAGAFSGGISGAAGAAVSASAANLLNELQDNIQQGLQTAGLSEGAAKTIAQGIAGLTAAGLGAAVGGGYGAATAATVDMNNRQLHPSEQKKAQELAVKSGGKYTAKQIEDALRSAGNNQTGESVIAGMVVDAKDRNAIYDKGAVWTAGDDGKLVQVLPPKPDAELAAFIKQNTGDTYSWYTPSPNTASPANAPRDRLTNLPLDDKGRYSQTMILD